MPSLNEILDEIQASGQSDALDIKRKSYLSTLHKITGRNIIAYYSGWLQRPAMSKTHITDEDKNALMSTIYKLDRSKGIDLILHTPGGDTAATESIVHYLRSMFGTDIRAIVPQIAMSAGTMIACSAKEIIMGKHSNLGPIDPQFNGIPCHGVIEEFQRALFEVQQNPNTIPLWQVIIGKYHPTFIGECEKAITWSRDMVIDWLKTGMFLHDPDADSKALRIVDALNDHKNQKTHARHIPIEECLNLGLKVSSIETVDHTNDFQDVILSIHHTYMLLFSMLPHVVKVVENHLGNAIFYQELPPQQQKAV